MTIPIRARTMTDYDAAFISVIVPMIGYLVWRIDIVETLLLR